jgi:N-acetyl sugar amidotransferase
MKVLFFVTNFYPFGKVEPLIADQIDRFSKEFDKIIIVSTDTINDQSYDLPSNVSVERVSMKLSRFQKIFGYINVFSKNVIEEFQFLKSQNVNHLGSCFRVMINYYNLGLRFKKKYQKIIEREGLRNEELFFHSYWCTEVVVGFCLIKNNYPHIKLFSRFHAFDLYLERHSPNYLPFRTLMIQKLDKFFFISEQGKTYFQSLYGEQTKNKDLIVNRLGVQIDEKYVVEKIKPENETFTIVSCSNMIELKRIHLIIEVLSSIDILKINWIHFGNGVLFKKIVSFAEEKLTNKENITYNFYGFIDNLKLKEYYFENQIDLFLNVSKYEGIPISIMEAFAFKIPVIATNVGGVSEIIDDKNGVLLDVDFTFDELKDEISRFYKMSLNEKIAFRENAFLTWQTKYDGVKNYESLVKEMLPRYKSCSRCIFDNVVYPAIEFNKEDVCSICSIYENLQSRTVFKGDNGKEKVDELILNVKNSAKNKKYDCIVGVSGGVDSSYVAYLVKEWNLRPLIIHVDNGWNSELAVKNIEQILGNLDYDLFTYVIDWEEMRDLQKSFINANVLDIDLPFDNAFMAILYRMAQKFGVKYILSGHNTVTEGWMPDNFTHYKLDTLNIKDIHQKFGTVKLKTFPLLGPLKFWYFNNVKKIQMVYPLDFIEYNKEEVKKLLIEKLGWRDYGGKHYENVYTKFYQGHILVKKFGIDKRVSHLSTLINSGQISREKALEEMKVSPYKLEDFEEDKTFFIKKLEMTEEEFEKYMNSPVVKHTNYKSYINVISKLSKIRRKLRGK